MLTKRQNLIETITGGKPDRFVNQYEAFGIAMGTPFGKDNPNPRPGQHNVVNAWGITKSWPEGTPGAFPVHDEEHIVVKDIENWKDYVKAPNVVYSAAEWEPFIAAAEKIDRNEQFLTTFVAPGIFEQSHYLCEIKNTLMYFLTNPDEMQELIKYLTEFELRYAEQICTYLKPECLFHHDDWGSQISTFMSPAMFDEFLLEPYKQVYGYYKSHGVDLIVHHSDSYAATLVPEMIEMGIDIWQGVMSTNNLPELIKKYGGKISFMGGIDSAAIDHEGWTKEEVFSVTEKVCAECGKLYFIPGSSQGLPMSTYPGVYQATTDAINECSRKMF